MTDRINDILTRIESFAPATAAQVEEFRIALLGKKGEIAALMDEFKGVAPELKRELGQKLNRLKSAAVSRIEELKSTIGAREDAGSARIDDMTRPGCDGHIGSRHPISLVKNRIVEIFSRLGYTVADGPEIEDDWHVFSALNFPPEHPARDSRLSA